MKGIRALSILSLACLTFTMKAEAPGDEFCGIRNTAFGAGEEISYTVYYAVAGIYIDAGNAVSLRDQIRDFCLHYEFEVWIASVVFFDEVEKIPLRHEAEKLTVRRQMSEVDERNHLIANLAAEFSDLLMRPLEKIFDQP